MTRQWTIEELDCVHPLPDRWLWSKRGLNSWCARKAAGGGWLDVWVSARGSDGPVLHTEHVLPCGGTFAGIPQPFPPPVDVALAVLLASKGLDSREAMAVEVEREASKHVPAGSHEIADRWAGYGREALARVAAMLRRGTVQP